MHINRHMLISMDRQLITTDPRFAISSNGERTWYLTISKVQDMDKGEYMCQINTNPMKKMMGHLHVVVPPKIDEEFTSSEVTVRENANVSLKCRATGNPKPDIRWKRDHDLKIFTSPEDKGVILHHGEYLNMSRVLRHMMGPYFCIGSNGVPPSISKRIKVNVAFPPMTWIKEQLQGVFIDESVNLTCEIEAYPRGEVFWTRDDGDRIERSELFDVSMVPRGPEYRYDVVLTIHRVRHDDLRSYKCVTKNAYGENEATVNLVQTLRPTQPTTKATRPPRKPKTKKPTSTPKFSHPTKHHSTRITSTEPYEEHPSNNEIGLYSDSTADLKASSSLISFFIVALFVFSQWRLLQAARH
ncbi:lachesin [Galendromus occidentalis]|uniref:Lachesin n=1 Tax=Galendromus occidentalis TaxID=34638 RepID=A0AAJ7SHQ1_9ACAR|nr:lachesin [Galendromus occidentalis]